MMRSQDQIVGIFREERFSPGRVWDDAAILSHTARMLERKGFSVLLLRPDQLSKRVLPRMAFAMCEGSQCLQILQDWHTLGHPVFNRPEAVRNCRRWRMYSLLANGPVLLPKGMMVETAGRPKGNYDLSQGLWVKRSDTHSTGPGDVRLVLDISELEQALAEFRSRRVKKVMLIEHIDGDLLKFYGVRKSGWFRYCQPKGDETVRYPVSAKEVQRVGEEAAERLGLDIYGGDIVIAGDKYWLIDMNSWPSFAAFRLEAAEKIAAFLAEHFTRRQPSNGFVNWSM